MSAAQIEGFRMIAAAMQTEPADWQWIGPHMSQRMFGITRTRAEGYAKAHGGTAVQMPKVAR
jgi:phosphopantetheinyl transferase